MGNKRMFLKDVNKAGLSQDQEKLLCLLLKVARESSVGGAEETARALTGLVGELLTCSLLQLTWCPRTGYDATDKDGNRYQIKTRRPSKGWKVNPQGRFGRFGRKGRYDFDYGVLVLLNSDYNIDQIYCADKQTIEKLESDKERGERGLHVSTFKKNTDLIYPASD